MILHPNAKINLGLNVVRKRPDGYHDLETVFYPIPLFDDLEVNPICSADKPYNLIVNGNSIGGEDEDNLVVKALHLLKNKGYDFPPVEIRLNKKIPSGAGMGGGYSDAAYMLKALNECFNLNISTPILELYSAELGADCAIFIQNKPVYAEGIGNIFTNIDFSLSGYYLVVVKPDIFISTKAAFSQIKPARPESNLKDIIKMPITKWKDYMFNDFEYSVFPQFPEIASIKQKLYNVGAIYAAMSGSGSSVFGIYSECQLLEASFPGCFYSCLKL